MIKRKKIKPKFITDSKGKKQSVILSLSEFKELLEDIEDLAAVAERRKEPTISHKELIKQLKSDGLI